MSIALPFTRAGALTGLHLGVVSGLAAMAAYLPMHAIGLKQAFWSAITAIAVVQTELHASEMIARNQFFGAAIGGAIGLAALLPFGDNLLVYMAAVPLAVFVCWVSGIGTASQLAGITVTILLLVPRTGPADEMLLARISEVAWGVAIGVCMVWLSGKINTAFGAHLRRRAGQHCNTPVTPP